jgi:hypothetical protein
VASIAGSYRFDAQGFEVMRVMVVVASIVGFGALILLGLLTMIRELFCESLYEAPFIADGDATRERAEHSPSRSSSTIPIAEG